MWTTVMPLHAVNGGCTKAESECLARWQQSCHLPDTTDLVVSNCCGVQLNVLDWHLQASVDEPDDYVTTERMRVKFPRVSQHIPH